MVHIVEHHGLQAVANVIVLSRMGFQFKKIIFERLLIVGRRLMDIGLIQIKSLLAVEKRVAFLQDGQSHVVHAPRLEGITQVSDSGRVVRQVFHNLVVLLLGLVGLALHSVDIDQVDK